MIRQKQLSLNDIYAGCFESFENDKHKFLSMLEEHLDIDALIPLSFKMHFRNHTGRPREYSLSAFILALIIQRIFSIHTDCLLIGFLTYSSVFFGDSAFDSIGIYNKLLGKNGLGFNNSAYDLKYQDCPINEDGVPC